MIDDDIVMPESQKNWLKTEISKQYIKNYTGKSRQSSLVTPQPFLLSPETKGSINRILTFEPTQPNSNQSGVLSSITNTVSFTTEKVSTTIRTQRSGIFLIHMICSLPLATPWPTWKITIHPSNMMIRGNIKFRKVKRASIRRKIKITCETYVEYRCQLSNSHCGNCFGQIFHEYGTKSVVLKIKTDPACKCSNYKRVRSGLDLLGKKHFEKVMKNEPNETTKTNTDKIMCHMVKETTIGTSNHIARSKLKKKTKNRRKYCKKVERATSLMQIPLLGNLIEFKLKHTFHVSANVPADLSTEKKLKFYRTTMYCNKNLPVIVLVEVDPLQREKEASMILLDGVPDPVSASLSEAERRLYNRIEELQKQKINSPHISAFAETTVFSSLALLWNNRFSGWSCQYGSK